MNPAKPAVSTGRRRLIVASTAVATMALGVAAVRPLIALAVRPATLPVMASTTTTHYSPAIPNSGPINTLLVIPDSPSEHTVLAASENGGIFQTTDGGATWTHESDFPTTHPMDLAFVSSSRVILASAVTDFETASTGGLYQRTETGSFSKVPGVIPTPSSRCPDYAGAHGMSIDQATSEIYVATDCGISIGTLAGGFHNSDVGAGDAAMMDVITLGSGHLIAGGRSGIFYSADDGGSWHQEETSGIDWVSDDRGRDGIHALFADPRGNGRAFAVTAQRNLYQTADYGATWSQITAPVDSDPCGGIDNVRAVMEAGQEKLYFGQQCDTNVSVLQQDGITWGPWTQLDVGHGDTRDIVFHADGVPYMVSSDGGLSIRGADDTHFTFGPGPAGGLDADEVTEVDGEYIPQSTTPDLYFGTQHNSVWSMFGTSTTPLRNSGAGEGFYIGMPRVVPHGGHNKITYVACGNPCSTRLALARFFADSTWNDPVAGVSAPKFLAPYDYVQGVDGTGGFSAGMRYTNNDGAVDSWRQIADFSQAQFGLPQAAAGKNGGPILFQPVHVGDRSDGVAQSQLVRVSNFGSGMGSVRYPAMTNFGSIGLNPTEFAWYEVFAVDPRDPSYLIAPDVFDNTVKVSHNGGESWSVAPGNLTALSTSHGRYRFSIPVANRLVPNLSVISFCPENDSRILVGTHQGGAFFSFDGGRTWTPVTDSAQITFATSVYWEAGCQTAYMSTYGRGIWKITMDLTTVLFGPDHACANEILCNLYDRFKPQPIPPGDPAIVVSDGWITSVQRSGAGSTVHVTPGSVISDWIRMPGHVTVMDDGNVFGGGSAHAARRAKAGLGFVAFFKNGKLVRLDRTPAEVRLYPHKPGTVGKGLTQPAVKPNGTVDIQGDGKANGTATTLVYAGDGFSVTGVPAQPNPNPIQLTIDGQVVAKANPNAKQITYSEKPETWLVGTHAVDLVAETSKGPQVLATGDLVVPNGDNGQD